MSKLFGIDLDGTLCHEHCWTVDDCLKATPRTRIVDMVNALYENEHHIIIWTARNEPLRTATEYWLKKNGVRYHAIDMQHKLGCDCYLDDKAINSIDERIACEQLRTYLR